jgi:type I restriction enzyme S subunit
MIVPALRFKEFSGDWIQNTVQYFIDNKSIVSHLDGNHGALYPKSSEFSVSGIPYIGATDFFNGGVDFINCKFLPEQKAKLFKKGVAKDGDVLFAHNATVGPCAILRTTFDYIVLSTTATYFRCDLNRISNSYLFNLFQSDFFVSQYSSIMSQSTRNQVPITTQRKLFLSLPSLPEQTKIANFLTAVDEKITLLTQKASLLSQYKKGVMQQIFSQELRFKDDNGQEFPEWEEKTLGDVADVKGGKRLAKGYSLQHENNGMPYITVSDMYQGGVDLKNIKYVPSEIAESIKNYKISINDIFISVAGTLGIVGIIPIELDNANLTENANKLTNLKCNQKYLLQYLMSDKFGKLIDSVKTTNAQPKLAIYAINSFVTFLPSSIEEQTKIANFLTAVDEKITNNQTQLNAVKQYKQGLLQQMFV